MPYQILSNCMLFDHLNSNQISKLFDNIQYKRIQCMKDTTIFSPNDLSQSIGIILKGNVEIQRYSPSGSSMIIGTKKPSDLIAAPSVYSSLEQYAGHVVAAKDCDILLIDKIEFTQLLNKDHVMLDKFLEFLSNQVVFMSKRVNLLMQNTLKKKIAMYIIGHLECDQSIIQLPFSKRKWAEYLNAQPQSISRTLRELEQNQLISFEHRTIQVLNYEALEKILS